MSEKSITLYRTINYKVLGNHHTLEQFFKRKIDGKMVKDMVKVSFEKLTIQKTYAIVRGNTKLLVLRIDTTKIFIITVLIDKMQLKRNKATILYV